MSPEDGTMTGNSVSFVFHDFETLFHGGFKDRVMTRAKEATVKAVDCKHGLPIITKVQVSDASDAI